MPYPITIPVDVSDDLIEQIIDSANTGCAYWADRGTVLRVDDALVGYTIEWAEETLSGRVMEERTLKPKCIAHAIESILTPGKVKLNDDVRKYIAHLDLVDIDDECADAIIQVAMFGEIVYG